MASFPIFEYMIFLFLTTSFLYLFISLWQFLILGRVLKPWESEERFVSLSSFQNKPHFKMHEATDKQNSIYDFGSSISPWSSSIDTWLGIYDFLELLFPLVYSRIFLPPRFQRKRRRKFHPLSLASVLIWDLPPSTLHCFLSFLLRLIF